jgi:hypothetical protein
MFAVQFMVVKPKRARVMTQKKLFNTPDQEVWTRSVPTAAALISAGFEPLRVISREAGVFIVFSPAAQDAIVAFLATKRRIEAMVNAIDGSVGVGGVR